MRRLLWIVFAAFALLAASISPSHAITGNYVADEEHPFVGLVAFYDEAGEFTGALLGLPLDP